MAAFGRCLQPFPLLVKGKREVFVLSQWVDLGQAVQPDAIRAGSLILQTPIHSFLFSSKGTLLLANFQATGSLKSKGTACHRLMIPALSSCSCSNIGVTDDTSLSLCLAGITELETLHLQELLSTSGRPPMGPTGQCCRVLVYIYIYI